MENRKLYTACQGKIPLRPLRTIAGAIEERRQSRRESEDIRMSIFKKPEKGFLAKLFKHKQVEELAEELAHTYADEMQEDMLSDNSETDTAKDTAAEPVPMLEVTESGEVDFTEPPETTEGESPPQDSADSIEPSEVRKHLIMDRLY